MYWAHCPCGRDVLCALSCNTFLSRCLNGRANHAPVGCSAFLCCGLDVLV